MPSLILWEAKGSRVDKRKPHCVIVRVCVCVYSVSREHNYDLQQLLSLSQLAVVLYYITFIISKTLSDSMELLQLHCFTQVMTKTQKGHKSPKAIEEIPQKSPEPLSS